VGSTAVRFFDANGSGGLIPSAGAARDHPICPGPTPDPKSTAKPTEAAEPHLRKNGPAVTGTVVRALGGMPAGARRLVTESPLI